MWVRDELSDISSFGSSWGITIVYSSSNQTQWRSNWLVMQNIKQPNLIQSVVQLNLSVTHRCNTNTSRFNHYVVWFFHMITLYQNNTTKSCRNLFRLLCFFHFRIRFLQEKPGANFILRILGINPKQAKHIDNHLCIFWF